MIHGYRRTTSNNNEINRKPTYIYLAYMARSQQVSAFKFSLVQFCVGVLSKTVSLSL